MSAAASLEALINEAFMDPFGPLRRKLPDFERSFWGSSRIDRQRPLEKYQIALDMLGLSRLDERGSHFRNTWALLQLRNALVHYKPAWDPDRKRKVEIVEILADRYEPSPYR